MSSNENSYQTLICLLPIVNVFISMRFTKMKKFSRMKISKFVSVLCGVNHIILELMSRKTNGEREMYKEIKCTCHISFSILGCDTRGDR